MRDAGCHDGGVSGYCMYAGLNVYGHMTHVAPPQRHLYTAPGIVGYVRKRLQKSNTAALHFAL
jgi:hypothetical protein